MPKIKEQPVVIIKKKIKIFKHLHKGEIATCKSNVYDFGRTTGNDINRDADKIEYNVSKIEFRMILLMNA